MNASRLLTRSLLAAALVACASGCPLVGVIADKVAGPAPVPAQFEPGQTTPLLVIAENFRAPTANASDADRVARLVGEQLAANEAATIVSPEKLALVRDMRPGAYAKMSVVDLGKAVGARQVLYIDLAGVGVGNQHGTDLLKGVASANVRVIDVASGTVLFPKDLADGVAVRHESPMRRGTMTVTPDAVRGETLTGLCGRISRLFHEYKPSDLEAIDTGL